MCYIFVNINESCQLGWHLGSNIHRSCHTVPLTDDVIQNPMSLKRKMSAVQKSRLPAFSKVSTFYSKIRVEASIFTRNLLYQDYPND